jgi:hypothetical protein
MKLPSDDKPTAADVFNAASAAQDANLARATHLAAKLDHAQVSEALAEVAKWYDPGHPVNTLAVIGATVYGETVRQAIKGALGEEME